MPVAVEAVDLVLAELVDLAAVAMEPVLEMAHLDLQTLVVAVAVRRLELGTTVDLVDLVL